MMTSRIVAPIAVSAVLVSAGCSRPLHVVVEEGDRSFSHGRYSEAADDYSEVASRDPGTWWAHYRLGVCLTELGKPVDARQQLETALTLRPGEPRIVDALAAAMLAQGDETALFDLVRGEAERRGTVEAYIRMGEYCDLLSDPDSAYAAYERAIELNARQSVEPYLEAAAFAQRLGDLDRAVRLLAAGYSVDPKDTRVRQRMLELGEVPGPTLAAP
jgi:Flp pilus assembly protein TadD